MRKKTNDKDKTETTTKPGKKKIWEKPKLSRLNTEHTQGTTPVLPGDAGNLRS